MMMQEEELARRRLSVREKGHTVALEAIARQQMAREAAASVSLSHRLDCVCVVCRAADGDEEALAEVFDVLNPL